YEELESPPTPSVADGLYLAFYPFVYAGLGLLIRSRFRGVSAAVWLDGLIAGLGLGAIAAGVVLDPILSSTGGSFAVVATNLAYPVGDLLLFLVVVTAISLTGWRPAAMWALMALGLIVNVGADTVYLFQVATSTYREGTWLEPLWPLSSLLLLLALWMPVRRSSRPSMEGWRNVLVPSMGALAAVGVLFVDHGAVSVNQPARYMAAGTLVVAVIRIVLAFRHSMRREEQSRVQALTDALTGLGNRRMLAEDLEEAIDTASEADPRLLVMYDLNGFKLYNDTFGHPAGDSLLARLGQSLAAVVAPYGKAYRMGGDEFCALLRPGGTPIKALAAATVAALAETGRGFEVDAAHGLAMLPADASTAATALQLADHRLYANKESRPTGVTRQLRGVLLQVLGEREPSLLNHLDGVAALALEVGRHMRLDHDALDVLVRAAEMHDIGKMAIPETILDKPGPLDEDEWAFMRRHTIFGERILAAAPALIPVAKLVRSSHERWDGGGYPDGLAGRSIPLGSRIICACDAYDAIISTRAYSAARSREQALAELSRCAGSQFDPEVVDALTSIVRAGVEDVEVVIDDLSELAAGDVSPQPAPQPAAVSR
ncbi:MAG TPA: HD domain-containing phosphohydrolase, partial [Solirubrobacteraceae bacterium]|nr:HD domain-containing phosphohydrolase [Solirubrobacteraceae bacterium]